MVVVAGVALVVEELSVAAFSAAENIKSIIVQYYQSSKSLGLQHVQLCILSIGSLVLSLACLQFYRVAGSCHACSNCRIIIESWD